MSRRSLKATAVVLALPCVAGKSAAATFFSADKVSERYLYCTVPMPVEGKTGDVYRLRFRIGAWKLSISSKSAGIYCTYAYDTAEQFIQSAVGEVASVW